MLEPSRSPDAATTLELRVERGHSYRDGQRYASVKAGDYTLFSELVYVNRESPAERNIMLLFSDKLRRLLEDE